jgi:hypothetical protein
MTKPAIKIKEELQPQPGRLYRYEIKKKGHLGYYTSMLREATEKVALLIKIDKETTTIVFNGILMGIPSYEAEITFVKEVERKPLSKQEAIKVARGGGQGIVGSMGADPEVFMLDKRKRLIPAFNVLPDKGKSKALTTAYWDGFQGEFTVEPSHCLAFVMDHVREGMRQIIHNNKKQPVVLSRKSVIPISKTVLETTPKKFLEFGCVPSRNAYTDESTAPDIPGDMVPFRMAGGHIHFGMTVTELNYNQIVKDLDYYLGTLGVVLFQGMDDRRRRELYGKAGEYRTPAHGLEYRTLSNAWLVHPAVAMLVFEIARSVAAASVLGRLPSPEFSEEEVIQCINTLDLRKARKIVDSNFELLWRFLGNTGVSKEFLQALLVKGVKDITPKTIEQAWALDNGNWRMHTESPGKNLRNASMHFNPKTELRLV